MKMKVSIIMPAYNAEKTIVRCINSLLNQTYRNIEIIIVNDGSTDSTKEICYMYKKKDNRIKVINQINKGVSVARNIGIKRATGELLTFVDSDDYMNELYIEKLVSTLLKTDSDIICSSFIKFNDPTKIKVNANSNEQICTLTVEDALCDLLSRNTKIHNYQWNKLYKKEIWKDIKFKDGKIYEDLELMYRIILKAKKIAYTTYNGYYYYINPDGLTSKFSIKDYETKIKFVKEREKTIEKLFPALSSRLVEYRLENITWILRNLCRKNRNFLITDSALIQDEYEYFKKEYNKIIIKKFEKKTRVLASLLYKNFKLFKFISYIIK